MKSGMIPSLFADTEMVDQMAKQTKPESSTGTSKPIAEEQPVGDDMSLLDRIAFFVNGTPDELLTPQELSRRQQKRANASSLAKSAHENPGASFMSAPTVGGSGFGLSDIVKLFQ